MNITNRAGVATLLIALALPAGAAAEAPASAASQALQWRLVGPFRGGRTRAVTGIPGQPETFLIGAVNGGVWKTTDYGRTWNPIFDSAPTQSIGAIAVAPSTSVVLHVIVENKCIRFENLMEEAAPRDVGGLKNYTLHLV